jgi:hypothetical protein
MGLNPGESKKAEDLRRRILDDQFNSGSPYYGMYHCGYYGVPIEECIAKCHRNGIAVRKKDLDSYNDGVFKRGVGNIVRNGQLINVQDIKSGIPFDRMKLEDFPKFPINWQGTERRFFPCTSDNRPMQKWGWSKTFTPELYIRSDAKALSPCGWVGQNMLYQKFIVLDIDGRGHGADDLQVIAFGNQFRDYTFTVEDPKKPGSFHLYFETDRLIPVRHFPWAKLDLMGNAVNAAVYFKNKVGNGMPMMKLNEDIWHAMIQYQMERKEK